MKKLVSAAAIVAAFAVVSSANAADMARPVYKAAPMAPIYNWTGFYIGGHVGAGESSGTAFWDPLPSSAAFGTFPRRADAGDSGLIAGAHIGYNWQAQNWVFGIEGDWTWTDISQSASRPWLFNPGGAVTPTSLTTLDQDVNWTASIRGRIGFLLHPQVLLYGTGGVAWADIDRNGSAIRTSNGYNAAVSISETKTGWVAGGGAEMMLTNNWLLRLEYLRYDFSNADSVVVQSAAFPAFPSRFSWDNTVIQSVRAGLSYKF